MSSSGRRPDACRAWVASGYVCDKPRDVPHGGTIDDDPHQDDDGYAHWWDDEPGEGDTAYPAPPPGPVPAGHPNYGKRDLIIDGDTVTIPHVVTMPRRIAELPPARPRTPSLHSRPVRWSRGWPLSWCPVLTTTAVGIAGP